MGTEAAYGGLMCPRCAYEGKENELSQLYFTEEAWARDCPLHGRFYVLGHFVLRKGGQEMR